MNLALPSHPFTLPSISTWIFNPIALTNSVIAALSSLHVCVSLLPIHKSFCEIQMSHLQCAELSKCFYYLSSVTSSLLYSFFSLNGHHLPTYCFRCPTCFLFLFLPPDFSAVLVSQKNIILYILI